MRWLPLLVISTACINRGPETHIVTLEELPARLIIEDVSGTATLTLDSGRNEPCLILSPRDTRLTLDGTIRGHTSPVPANYSTDGDCGGSGLYFDGPEPTSTRSTIELTDAAGSTWRFVGAELFTAPDFTITPNTPRVGDVVTLHYTGSSTIEEASIDFSGPDGYFSLAEPELSNTGHDLVFTMPNVSGQGRFFIRATIAVRFDVCDAPLGCDVSRFHSWIGDLTISP